MADLTLYHAAPSRSSIVLWMLEEVGEPYDIRLLKLSAGDNRKPDYLAMVMDVSDETVFRVAADSSYKANRQPPP